jgi:hypothetical protein
MPSHTGIVAVVVVDVVVVVAFVSLKGVVVVASARARQIRVPDLRL